MQDIFDTTHQVATEGKGIASTGISTVSDGLWNMGSFAKTATKDIYENGTSAPTIVNQAANLTALSSSASEQAQNLVPKIAETGNYAFGFMSKIIDQAKEQGTTFFGQSVQKQPQQTE